MAETITKVEILPLGPNSRTYEVNGNVGPLQVTSIKDSRNANGRVFIYFDDGTVVSYPRNSCGIFTANVNT